MARVTFRLFDSIYDGDFELEDASWSGTANKGVYRDKASGDKLVLEGTHLKYDHGELAGGKVTAFTLVDADGSKYYAIEDVKLSAKLFAADDFLSSFEDILGKVLKNDTRIIGTNLSDEVSGQGGNDILLGRGGQDWLAGGAGKDILTGGGDADIFTFGEGWGKDTITDFDADGSDGKQDLLNANFDEIESITRSRKNTVIDFGDGDTLTLLDVRPAQVDQTDFVA